MRTVKGAEATVEIGNQEVTKSRESKKYRHPELDDRLRKERTETEVRLMEEAGRYNVNVPDVEKQDDSTISMEKIDGEILKNLLDEKHGLVEALGENIAYLHSADIIHGDLTTSNAIVTAEGEVYVIDFGLAFRSQRIEDKAVDLHLLKQVLDSSHPEMSEEAWQGFVDGYSGYGESEKVFEQLKDVEQRGRYK